MFFHFLYIEVNVKQRVLKKGTCHEIRVSPQINDGGGAALMNWCKLHFLKVDVHTRRAPVLERQVDAMWHQVIWRSSLACTTSCRYGRIVTVHIITG